jgi:hypothetical protein
LIDVCVVCSVVCVLTSKVVENIAKGESGTAQGRIKQCKKKGYRYSRIPAGLKKVRRVTAGLKKVRRVTAGLKKGHRFSRVTAGLALVAFGFKVKALIPPTNAHSVPSYHLLVPKEGTSVGH